MVYIEIVNVISPNTKNWALHNKERFSHVVWSVKLSHERSLFTIKSEITACYFMFARDFTFLLYTPSFGSSVDVSANLRLEN